MSETIQADLCVIGAGSAGLSVAAGASQLGARTVLIEAGRMGGDCLNYGCVPSKSLLAAGHVGHLIRGAARFGVDGHEPEVDFARVHDHVHEVIAGIAPIDSQERFEGLGVTVIRARAGFISPDEVQAGEVRIRARRFVVASGSSPAVPPIPGLKEVAFHTNETIFDNRTTPAHLMVLGGGPVGCELAQAYRRLGAEVTILDLGPILAKDDPELAAVVRAQLQVEGVTLFERIRVEAVEPSGNGISVRVGADGRTRRVDGSHLLVAAGRSPNVQDLGLDAARIDHDGKGIIVDRQLRTSNRKVYAIGDVVGGHQFTHLGNYHAGIVIRKALFRLPAKVDHSALPWVTYTDPELAHVGLTEAQARERGRPVEILRWSFADNDRARTERATDGLIKVVATRRGRVLGASIVGAHAGELILPWVLAIGQGLKVRAVAEAIVPYPTRSEVSKRAAGAFYTPRLFSSRTRWLVRQLARLP